MVHMPPENRGLRRLVSSTPWRSLLELGRPLATTSLLAARPVVDLVPAVLGLPASFGLLPSRPHRPTATLIPKEAKGCTRNRMIRWHPWRLGPNKSDRFPHQRNRALDPRPKMTTRLRSDTSASSSWK
jgi:hypothetical protein